MSKPYDEAFPGTEDLPNISKCIKCSSPDQTFGLNEDMNDPKHFRILCCKCGHSGSFETNFEKAISSWNYPEEFLKKSSLIVV